MPSPRLATRYAKSIIDLANSRNELDAIYNDMLFLQSIFSVSKEFANVLKSPIINADKKEKIIDAVTRGKITVLTETFIKLLISKGRELNLSEIVTSFIQQYKDLKEIYIVNLTTAVPVSEELKNSIINKIKSETNMKNIELIAEVKEEILGGFILEFGDHLIDVSVAFDLNNVRKQFRNNDFIYKLR